MSEDTRTPGQVLREAWNVEFGVSGVGPWKVAPPAIKEGHERIAAALLAHHDAGKADEVARLRAELDKAKDQLYALRVRLSAWSSSGLPYPEAIAIIEDVRQALAGKGGA